MPSWQILARPRTEALPCERPSCWEKEGYDCTESANECRDPGRVDVFQRASAREWRRAGAAVPRNGKRLAIRRGRRSQIHLDVENLIERLYDQPHLYRLNHRLG